MAIRKTSGFKKVHPETAAAARKIAREELGVQEPKLRPATSGEQLKGLRKSGFDLQQVRDVVVVEDRKNGREFLLGIDLDPAESKHLNAESGVLTWCGLIPMVGAPVVAGFALKDLIKGGLPAIKAKFQGEAVSPRDRALLRMGTKHMGLATLSTTAAVLSKGAKAAEGGAYAAEAIATTAKGVDAGVQVLEHAEVGAEAMHHAAQALEGGEYAKDGVAKTAKMVKKGVKAAEVLIGAKDISDAKPKGVKGVAQAIGTGVKAMVNTLVVGMKSLVGVHHPEHHHHEDPRVIFAEERPLQAKESAPETPATKRVRERPESTGPPKYWL